MVRLFCVSLRVFGGIVVIMATNPNPSRIAASTWSLWEAVEGVIPGVRLGGIYALKPGYHSTVADNRSRWPGNYSITLPLDLVGPHDKARAIDLTMSTTEMRKRTGYLKDSALDDADDRLFAVREFYGTTDGRNVYGLIKRTERGKWTRESSDTSHLWHIHIGIFTKHITSQYAHDAILSVLSGETYKEWQSKGLGGFMIGLRKGDSGEEVTALQGIIRNAGFDPGPIDGEYGNKTSEALLDLRKSLGSAAESGDTVTGTAVYQLFTALAIAMAKKYGSGVPGPVGPQGPPGPVPKTLTVTEWGTS